MWIFSFRLGEGGFGTVMLVKKKRSGGMYALKLLEKSRMTQRGIAERVIAESVSLQYIRHPFVVTLHYAFQDSSRVYFVLEHVAGGDLFGFLQDHRSFPEAWCRLYLAEIAMALDWVHKSRFVYRDVKPENILVANDGHLKLADFGTAKRLPAAEGEDSDADDDAGEKVDGAGGSEDSLRSSSPQERLHTIIGTPGILAPELFLEKGYGYSVDWWGLGALFSEMLLGRCAIISQGDNMRALIDSYRTGTHLCKLPDWVSPEAASMLTGLLTVARVRRLGCSADGLNELKAHPFLAGLDWEALYRKETPAPLAPHVFPSGPPQHGGGVRRAGSKVELDTLEALFAPYVNDDADAAAESDDGPKKRAEAWSYQLCNAAAQGGIEELRELVARGAPVNEGDYDQRTAIHLAASEGMLEVVQVLVKELGANCSPRDRWGHTPLDDAIRAKHSEVAKFLLLQGAVSGQPLPSSSTPLRVRRPSMPSAKRLGGRFAAAAVGSSSVHGCESFKLLWLSSSDSRSASASPLPADPTKRPLSVHGGDAYFKFLSSAGPSATNGAPHIVGSDATPTWGDRSCAPSPAQVVLPTHLALADVMKPPPRGETSSSGSSDTTPRPETPPVIVRPSDPFVCPLGGQRMQQPVVAGDGYTYERAELDKWVLQYGRVSPISGEPLSGVLLANRTLKELIDRSAADEPDRPLKSLGDLSELSRSPLTTSAACDQISALRSALATKTYNVNRRDADGDRCPLHWAAARGHTRCAVALLKAGADPTMFEVSSGLTCSELAASRGHEKLAAILRSAAAQYTSW